MTVGEDKAANLARAANLVKEAANKGARFVALPVSLRLVTVAMQDAEVPSYPSDP